MHESSRIRMERFAELCAFLFKSQPAISILDVGGGGVTYESIFRKYLPNSSYETLNLKGSILGYEDKAANILVEHPYNWIEVPDDSYDIVISGQTFEHIEYPWLTMLEIRRILKPGGWTCIIAPSHWPEHLAPLDTYRYNRDGLMALVKYAGLNIFYGGADHPLGQTTYQDLKGDAYIIAFKETDCGCDTVEKYKRATLTQLEIVDQKKSYDIARHATIYQSGHAYEEERCIGASYNFVSGDFTGEYAIHTNIQSRPWILLDLKRIYNIEEIRLFNRKNLEDRARDLEISISSDLKNFTSVKSTPCNFGGIWDGRPLVCRVNANVRYILLSSPSRICLHFDQIQIISDEA